MLNKGLAYELQRLHNLSIRICFGLERRSEEIRSSELIETHYNRRSRRTYAFIAKAAANPRIAERWFPRWQGHSYNLRNRRNIVEVQARTLWRFNSPLEYMRRRENELGLYSECKQNATFKGCLTKFHVADPPKKIEGCNFGISLLNILASKFWNFRSTQPMWASRWVWRCGSPWWQLLQGDGQLLLKGDLHGAENAVEHC